MNIYQQNGFADRIEYFKHLGMVNNVRVRTVAEIADQLGPDEDFRGLVTELTHHKSDENFVSVRYGRTDYVK